MQQSMEERGFAPIPGGKAPETTDADSAVTMGMSPPASPAGYVISLPRGVERDPDLEAAARGWFHAAGLPQGVASGIAREYCRHICEPQDPVRAQRLQERAMAELRREWGPDFDRKIALARSVIEACRGGDALDDVLTESGLAGNAWLLRTLAALGEMRAPANGGAR